MSRAKWRIGSIVVVLSMMVDASGQVPKPPAPAQRHLSRRPLRQLAQDKRLNLRSRRIRLPKGGASRG